MGSIIDVSEVLLDLGLSSSVTDEERAIVNAAIGRAEGAIKKHLQYDPVQRTRTEFYPQMSLNLNRGPGIWEVQGGSAIFQRASIGATSELQVQHIPIRSITDLFIDYDGRSGTRSGAFASDTAKTEGVDFHPNYDGLDDSGASICRDGLIRSLGLWPTEAGTVKLISIAGYTLVELHGQDTLVDAASIGEAVVDEAVRRAKKAFVNKKKTRVGFAAGPVSGERLGDYSYTINTAVMNRMFGGTTDLLAETVLKLSDFVNLGWQLAS